MAYTLINESRIPTKEAKRLIDLAVKGLSREAVDNTDVILRDGRHSIKGWAADPSRMRIPHHAADRRTARDRYLICLWIGQSPKLYPANNLRRHVKHFPVGYDETQALEAARVFAARSIKNGCKGVDIDHGQKISRWGNASSTIRVTYWHPYGGVTAPLIVKADWRESLVSLAAHEMQHVVQFVKRSRLSEVECERVAAKALERYRKSTAETA